MSEQAGIVQTDSTKAPIPARPSPGREPVEDKTNIKETIESILVAFILAFIFRAFVVEAFVIPTGSMAPTLLGAHMRFRCPDCGYTFDVNYSSRNEEESEDMRLPPGRLSPTDIYCPNCGYRIANAAAGLNGISIPARRPRQLRRPYSGVEIHLPSAPPRRLGRGRFQKPRRSRQGALSAEFHQAPGRFTRRKAHGVGWKYLRLEHADTKWEIPQKPSRPRRRCGGSFTTTILSPAGTAFGPPQFVQPWKPDGPGWDMLATAGLSPLTIPPDWAPFDLIQPPTAPPKPSPITSS